MMKRFSVLDINTALSQGFMAFFAITYIPFVIVALLGFMQINNDYLWFTCCSMLACTSLIASLLAKKPIAAGPSIAGVVIIASKFANVISDPKAITAIILLSALILIILSMLNLTNSLLSILNENIKTGFRAGVGLMFIGIALQMLTQANIINFLGLTVIFFCFRNLPVINAIICILLTVILNHFHLEPSLIASQSLIIPSWHLKLIPLVIMLVMTMFIDCTITGNTLNPGKEDMSLKVAGFSSIFGGLLAAFPCSIYLESLVFNKNTKMYTLYFMCLLFLLLAFIGKSIIIPTYLSAALLANLGLKIILMTKPKLWLKNLKIISIILAIAYFKSFLYGITLGVILEPKLDNKQYKYWLIFLVSAVILVNFKFA